MQVYQSQLQLQGNFNWSAYLGRESLAERIRWKSAHLALGVSDNRGLRSISKLQFGEQQVAFKPGTALRGFSNGIQAPLSLDMTQDQQVAFSLDVVLDGMESLSFVPVGDDTQIELSANWPHPSFMGDFLPSEHHINQTQFTAHWQTSLLATNMHQMLQECDYCTEVLPSVGVNLIEPIDIYLQAERSAKYALLFIALTFVVFFLFEILKQLAVHPIQYALVGMALALFYLLLVSLSEHMRFIQAYGIAAASCIGLISYYVSYVLHSWRRGVLLGVLLTLLYAVLFVLIQSEDRALLMGSVLLFLILATMMVLTRKLDWYQVGLQSRKAPPL